MDAEHLLANMEERPWEYGFFNAVLILEQLHPDSPPLGRAALPRHEKFRLGQEPFLSFQSSTVTKLDRSKRLTLYSQFFGFYGPNGALPIHLTEYVFARLKHAKDPTLAHFLDLFQHRAQSMFYRAWADSHPVTQQRQGKANRFAKQLGSLAGIGLDSSIDADQLGSDSKRFLAGLFSRQHKDAESLRRILTAVTGLEVSIEELRGGWVDIDSESTTRLGVADGNSTLGVSASIGRRVWLVQHRFRIVLGPLKLREYLQYLPGEPKFKSLTAAVRQFTTDEFDWDVNLVLLAKEVPVVRLARQGRLGLTSWLGTYPHDGVDCADVVIRPNLNAAIAERLN